MFEEKDPVTDRDEFKSILESIICVKNHIPLIKIVYAMIDQDEAYINKFKSFNQQCKDKVQEYLSLYDKCENDEERKKVVGSTKGFTPEA